MQVRIIIARHGEYTHSVYLEVDGQTTGLDYMADTPNAAYHAQSTLRAVGISAAIEHVDAQDYED